jgi:hypothetical protein
MEQSLDERGARHAATVQAVPALLVPAWVTGGAIDPSWIVLTVLANI